MTTKIEDVAELEMDINDGGMSYEDEDYVGWVVEEACKEMSPWQADVFALHISGVKLDTIASMAGVTKQAVGIVWRKALGHCQRVSARQLSTM